MTAAVAGVLAVGLPARAIREVCSRAAYALGDGGIAVRAAVTAMVVNVAGDLLLAPVFGVAGIAAATVAASVVGAAVAAHGLHRRHRALPRLIRPLGGIVGAGLVAAPAGLLVDALTRDVLPGATGDALVVVAVGITVLAGYFALLRITAPGEFRLLADVPRQVLVRRRR